MSTTLIKNARIVTGDGRTPPFPGNLLLDGDRIAAVGEVASSDMKTADRVIDAEGKMTAPGFIDTHNHGALGGTQIGPAGVPFACELALRAGVTKRICGVDGFSPAPIAPMDRAAYAEQLRPLDGWVGEHWPWSTMPEFYAWHRGKSITDMGVYLGHSTVRRAVLGNAPRKAELSELEDMARLVRREAPHVLGFSTGLIYHPAVFSDGAEIAHLLRAFAEVAPAALFPHLRSESDMILPSLAECLTACVESGAAYGNEHSKIAGEKNYDKIGALEDMLADGAASVRCMANMYPYTAGSTTGDAIFPPEFRAGSREDFRKALTDPDSRRAIYRKIRSDTTGWDNFIYFCGGLSGIRIAGAAKETSYLGRNLADVARDAGAPDPDSEAAMNAVCDFFLRNDLDITIIAFYGSELVMERLFRRDDMAICTDGLMPGPGQKPHPRSLGSFPKALRMARELEIPAEKMIYRMSTLPTTFLGLEDPSLREGADASLVLFDWENVAECNDYDEPLIHPRGIDKVWVHGELVLDEGLILPPKIYPGRILQRHNHRSL
ncbi:MAG: amidohydrolase family protein [Acidobacteriota bacterium]|nr:amidohydrolase family protein [Acidobacteriota bacterium]